MTDAEKIEWLTATNKALMESQERLAGEVKELKADLDMVDSDDRIARRRFESEVLRLQEDNKQLRKLLRHFFNNGSGIPYSQWTREQHAAYDILQKGLDKMTDEKEYSQNEVNIMTNEMIALRKEYERAAFRRGAEAMRLKIAIVYTRREQDGWYTGQETILATPIPEYTDAT
jgi:hypothetical protein